MTIRNTPAIAFERPSGVQAFDPLSHPDIAAKWTPGVKAADGDQSNVISVLDVIGEDFRSGGGVTAKRVAAALRSIKADEVVVDVNSPGGDFFEGVAIYNLLRQDERRVRVRVLGEAASAASVIAMAGDVVEIGRAAFLMVHNAWAVAIGNRHDMAATARTLEPFDDAMAAVYAAKSGKARDVAAGWMDAETWFNGEQAVAEGLADVLLAADIEISEGEPETSAMRRLDTLLAKANVPRSERRALLTEAVGGKPGAAADAKPSAGDWLANARALIDTIKH